MRNLIFVLLLAASTLSVIDPASGQDSSANWFDGKPRTFVVNGYSTSFHWPAMLQRKLDRYFDGKRIIEVKMATKGLTPIARWMNVETGRPLQNWTNELRPLLNDDSRPTIVLAQQSLQWVFGKRTDGIRSEEDVDRIRQGAEAIKTYVELLKADGADAVVIAMHIYKKGQEPKIRNERLALTLFMESNPDKVFAGPDVWTPTSKIWPQAFESDKVHPNAMGAEVMAHHWFATVLKLCGKDVPPWSEKEMNKAMASPTALASGRQRQQGGVTVACMLRHDTNKDGKVTKAEFRGPAQVFSQFDRNGDGVVDKNELTGRAR